MVLADQGFLSGTAFLPLEVGSGVFSLIFSRMNSHSLLWSFLPQGFLQISFQFSLVGILLISTWILWISFLDSGCSQISLSSSLVPCLNFAKFGSSRGAMFFAPFFDISLSLDWLISWEPVTGRGILFSCGFQVLSWQKRSINFVFSPVSCQVSRVGFLPRMALVRRIQL